MFKAKSVKSEQENLSAVPFLSNPITIILIIVWILRNEKKKKHS